MRVRRGAVGHRMLIASGVVALPLALVTACGHDNAKSVSGSKPTTPRATITITPKDGSSHQRPDLPIQVRSSGGKLHDVSVEASHGRKITGAFNAAHTSWRSKWTMSTDAKYKVSATAVNSKNKLSHAASTFTTLSPSATFAASSYSPASDGATVGVGFPVVVNFSRPIYNKARVERALELKMSTPVEGAWHWMGANEVVFRPRTYWPVHEQIHVIGHLDGVRGARGVYGTKDLSLHYTVGNKVVVTANTKTHQLVVKENGKEVHHWPISAGRGGQYKYYTTSGIHLTMDKGTSVWMTSPGVSKGSPGYYHELIHYAVRISNSGEYIHSMPSTVWAQGHQNVSHGCINSPPSDAIWFYHFEHPGDIVNVTGTPRKLEYTNGWGFWQASWKTWLGGSALHKPINAGATPSASPSASSSSPSSTPSKKASKHGGR